MTLYYSYFEHPITNLLLISSPLGLREVWFVDLCPSSEMLQKKFPDESLETAHHQHDELHMQLGLYLDGVPVHFTAPLDLQGTPFQKQVWSEIQRIQFGTTVTYGEIAKHLGNPKGSRAVGGATGKNPVPLIIPCHRVMGTGGKLTGFSAPQGIELKKKLLKLEGLQL